MTLRARVLVWGAVLYIGFIAILGVLGAWSLQKSYLALEATEVRAKTEETARVFLREAVPLTQTAEDWAAWDDADEFIRRPNPDFIRANLGIPSLTAIKVDLIAFIETGTSRIVEARALDWRRGVAETFPVSMTDHLGPDHPLIASSASGAVVSGLLALPEGVLFVAAAPIRPSDRRGPISGTLVMGRFIRENAVDDLKRLSGHEVTLTPTRERLAEGIRVLPLDDRRISGEKALADLHGEPVLSLRIVLPRVIHLQGRRSSFHLLASLIVAGLAAFAAILFILDRYVIRRLQDLSDQVAHVDLDARCFAIRIKGADEISVLARNINRLLATVDLNRAALKESETRHRRIVETASEGILMLNASRRIAYANRRLTEMLGLPLAELLGRPFTDFMPSEEIPDHERRHGKHSDGAAGDRYERRLRRNDGEFIWCLVSTTPIVGPEGQFQGTFAMVADISEQKRVEKELRDREEWNRAIFGAMQTGLVVIDAETHCIVDLNPVAEQMIGFSREECIGRICHNFICPAEAGKCPVTDLGQVVENAERVLLTADGREVPILKSVTQIEMGGRRFIIDSFVDLTERKVMENLLRGKEEQFRAIATSANDAIVMIDAEGLAILWNPAAEHLFGWRAAEVLGRRVHEILAPPDLRAVHQSVFPAWSRTGEGAAIGKTLELRAQRRDGSEIPIEMSLASFQMGEVWHAVAIIRDISERKQMQEKLVGLEKRESIALLAGGVAHDLNNILTAIGGSVDELRLRLVDLAERECVDDIATAADQAADLTRQLLALGRRQILAPVDLDLNRELGRFKRILRRIIRGDIAIKLRLDEEPVLARMDIGQLERVLLNLALNAQEAMPKGGTLILETATVSREASTPATDEARREIRLSMRDSGVGMTPEVRARIFEPFFTTRSDGAGLGLPSVLGIVEQSGGRIEVESEVGQGTVFHIFLPEGETPVETASSSKKAPPAVAPPSVDASRATTPAATPAAADAGAVILVADDQEAILKVTRRALERRGYLVRTVPDGLAATRLAEELERLDLLLTDVMMPNLDGFEAAARIHVTRPGLPVLFMSGYIEELGEAAKNLSAENFLAKPFSVDELLARVAALLAGKTGDRS